MKYENAKDVLPAALLAEIQKYAEGKVIYIPKLEKTKGWNKDSVCKQKVVKRNELICSRHSSGQSVYDIAEEFYLSPDTVKGVVYGKKVRLQEYTSAIASII